MPSLKAIICAIIKDFPPLVAHLEVACRYRCLARSYQTVDFGGVMSILFFFFIQILFRMWIYSNFHS